MYYIKIPLSFLTILAVLYGVNEIILLTTINFPASVTCMLLLYLCLLACSWIWGPRRAAALYNILKVPGDFALKWINIFFTPAFITLPLSEWISAREALTIAAVFVVGYFAATALVAYFTIFLQKILGSKRRADVQRGEELNNGVGGEAIELGTLDKAQTTARNGTTTEPLSRPATSQDTTTDTSHEFLRRVKSLESAPQNIIDEIARGDEDSIETRYRRQRELRDHLELIDRIEQVDDEDDETDVHNDTASDEVERVSFELQENSKTPLLERPGRAATRNGFSETFTAKIPQTCKSWKNKLFCRRTMLDQNEPPLTRKEQIAEFVLRYFDYLVYATLIIVSIPIYYAVDYEMPLQLMIALVTFLFMIKVPPLKYRKFLHPVLCSVGLSWLLYFIFAIIKGQNFLDSLKEYKTGRNYLKLFNHKANDKPPGAGDVFSSLMDVSIVSLALPMYTYRMDLKRHFFALLPPILLMTFGCFFIYPPLCYHLGISAERSLGFAGRSVTLALGTPFVEALGGSVPLMAVTTVVSGIIGALSCEFVFGKILHIREDDYVTRGITLGVNCGAIATAHLLTIDPRAAAMSSLSFVLFGTFMVVLASINPLAHVVEGWVGL